ncbi:MAG: hypothetical protein NT028_10820 [candidate division Zixibacteria bacterium]|nr:hypothetical protein [candidate division Zixibacteria bacterium]
MKLSWTLLGALALVITILLLASCSSEQKQQGNATSKASTAGQTTGSCAPAGIEWKVPTGWVPGPEKPMRVATYAVGGLDAPAECAVFFFGAGQGGDVDANIARWISQVKQPDGSDSEDKAVRDKVKSACCQITTIEVAGTYLASSGAMMQTTAEKPGFVLLGAIVPGPKGNVFFKFTGPKTTVDKAKEDFLGLLRSVNKQAD